MTAMHTFLTFAGGIVVLALFVLSAWAIFVCIAAVVESRREEHENERRSQESPSA
jgi:large-conductance mechanosensitive channel